MNCEATTCQMMHRFPAKNLYFEPLHRVWIPVCFDCERRLRELGGHVTDPERWKEVPNIVTLQ